MDAIFENRNTISNFDCSYGEKTFHFVNEHKIITVKLRKLYV